MCMTQVARMIRRDLFDETETFNGTFPSSCQIDSIPTSLLSLVSMIMEGPNIKDQTSHPTGQVALTIAQLIKFNSVKHNRQGSSSVRHTKAQETPLPLYIGTMLHSHVRKRGLIDKLFDLGLSVSYDRVLRMSTEIANAVCKLYEEQQVVCPPKLKQGVFTTAAIDNIDHNPSSATATGSFHGTGISLIQHPSFRDEGTGGNMPLIRNTSSTKCINPLPQFYTNVPPVLIKTTDAQMPAMDAQIDIRKDVVETGYEQERKWLESAEKSIGEQRKNQDQQDLVTKEREEPSTSGEARELQTVSWSAFHSKQNIDKVKTRCSSSLLPLFPDSAHSLAMLRHGMIMVKLAVQHINPGQIPVLACDQPLYALAKEIQWTWPDELGENQIVIMFGGLHIEMASLKAIGTWLDGSGWTEALVQAEVTTAGKADAILQASHVMRTRYAHQVSAASLYQLQKMAYSKYLESSEDEDELGFLAWCKQRSMASPQFQYWSTTLEFELLILIFVRSLRNSDFELYIAVLNELASWFFALDRTNYARWIPVHIKDMLELKLKHPEVHKEFSAGKFTVQKTMHAFSAIPLDQAHEQNNELVKGDGGAIGLTENPSALLRWMVAGPEVARMVYEFEQHLGKNEDEKNLEHHDQSEASQSRFASHVNSLVKSIDEMGNPFEEQSQDLISLASKAISDPSVHTTVREARQIGQRQYNTYVEERLKKRAQPVQDLITRNKLPLLKERPQRAMPKNKMKLQSAKNNCQLFSKLYIGCQNRDGNLPDFFSHENQGCPPSLSDGGTVRLGTKSDLLPCLEKLIQPSTYEPVPTTAVLDGAAIVQMLKPGTSKTFLEYSDQIFLPYLKTWLNKVQRLDIVWDVYFAHSLKAATRAKRGKGSRRRVLPAAPIPNNWQDFLRVNDNKEELFQFLGKEAGKLNLPDKEIVVTTGQNVLTYPPRRDLSQLSPCTHEEADTRIFVHIADAVAKGHQSIVIRTVDTDVVVLAVAAVHILQLQELWVAFGTGKKLRYLPSHAYATALGSARSKALPVFHAFTGSDTTSFFCGHGKKTAWATWESFPESTDAFLELVDGPSDVTAECLTVLERFVVLMYDRTSPLTLVNDARMHLFTKKGRVLDGLPPTQAALIQHIRRATYQGGHIWGRSTLPTPVLPSPTDWGWIQIDDSYHPLWSTLPEAAKSCYELIHCGCKKGCVSRCKCVLAALPCTPLCACDGQCSRD